ncbi:MAG: hypothetical protein WA879_14740, partial [Candidatus Acidiferrales bacterium]
MRLVCVMCGGVLAMTLGSGLRLHAREAAERAGVPTPAHAQAGAAETAWSALADQYFDEIYFKFGPTLG